MTESAGVVRQIAWRELFPWLILLRTFRLAISPSLLAVATVAVLLTSVGWRLSGLLFLKAEEREALVLAGEHVPRADNSQLANATPAAPRPFFPTASSALLDGYFDLAEPLARLWRRDLSLRETAFYVFGFLWMLVVWAFPGGMITRRAVVQLAIETPQGIRREVIYAGRRYYWYLLAPLYPILGLLLLALPIMLLGLPLRIVPGLGAVFAGLCWMFVLIAGLGAMWLLGGLIFGWPLMWPTISAERDGDPFEAFSRSYSYVYGKPLHYFFYVVVAASLGALAWSVAWSAAQLVQEFGFWALAWGGGGQRVTDLRRDALILLAGGSLEEAGRLWSLGAMLISWALGLLHAVTTAFRYTFFFSTASAIYLLLRHDVDEKEMDEVFLDEPTSAET